MGISLSAWRTAFGKFQIKDKPLNKFKTPKHSFNENFMGLGEKVSGLATFTLKNTQQSQE